MSKISFKTILFGIIIIGLVIYVTLLFDKSNNITHEYYQVYLSGKKIGLIKSKDELFNLIDEEQKEIKEEYNVSKIYPPSGLEVQNVITYNTNLISANKVYEEIKDLDPFTIEGYEVTIKEKNKTNKFYILNKEDLDTAIENTILAFVNKEDYKNYINNTQKKITEEGVEITNVYFDQEVTYKKAYISTEEKIFTNADELSTYFLFGTTELKNTYTVKSSDTIETISDKNKLGVSDFLIANPNIAGENALLAVGQEVTIAPIAPLANIVVESYQTELQTVSYDTKVEYDKNVEASVKYVKQQGEDGLSKVRYATHEINGVIQKTKLVEEEVIKGPVDKIVVMGAKNVVYFGDSTFWAWPTTKPFRISSGYGWRVHPITHVSHFHPALDITGTKSKNIYAIQNGKVTTAKTSGYNSGQGKYITINHQNGYVSQYLHLSKVLVKEGEEVEKGQIIGIMGCTGSCTGTHLDFRVKKNGESINPFNLYK